MNNIKKGLIGLSILTLSSFPISYSAENVIIKDPVKYKEEIKEINKAFPLDIGDYWLYNQTEENYSNNLDKHKIREENPALKSSYEILDFVEETLIREGYKIARITQDTGLENNLLDKEFYLVVEYKTGNIYKFSIDLEDSSNKTETIENLIKNDLKKPIVEREYLTDSNTEYIFPLNPKNKWGFLGEKDDSGMYCWIIFEEKEGIEVPAGKFDNSTSIILRTGPDYTIKHLVPGIGLVSEEYSHHGTPIERKKELIKTNLPRK